MKILKRSEPKGERFLERLERRREVMFPPAFEDKIRAIVRRVAERGDRALVPLVRRYDLKGVARGNVPLFGQLGGREAVAEEFIAAVDLAIANLELFHTPQVPHGYSIDVDGVDVGVRVRPLDSVGIYVPGGGAVSISSLLMAVVPARLAGVSRISVATPPRAFLSSAPLRFVLGRLGLGEVYLMGGAHAIAALAYGTESVVPVDRIVAPGGRWVMAAKRAVAGVVGVDSLGGPSELVVIADGHAEADVVAADLVAQAEHDEDALSIVLTPSAVFAERVDRAIRARVRRLAKDAVAREALRRRGATIVVADLAQAVGIVNRLAPELVSVQVEDPRRLLDSIENAGVVFLGPWSAVALGDFVAGANHVVPTGGSARYSSPLRVADFVHRTSVVEVPAHQYGRLALAAETFAIHQDLPEDAASLRAGRRGAV